MEGSSVEHLLTDCGLDGVEEVLFCECSSDDIVQFLKQASLFDKL